MNPNSCSSSSQDSFFKDFTTGGNCLWSPTITTCFTFLPTYAIGTRTDGSSVWEDSSMSRRSNELPCLKTSLAEPEFVQTTISARSMNSLKTLLFGFQHLSRILSSSCLFSRSLLHSFKFLSKKFSILGTCSSDKAELSPTRIANKSPTVF